jgi:hypothetical protein
MENNRRYNQEKESHFIRYSYEQFAQKARIKKIGHLKLVKVPLINSLEKCAPEQENYRSIDQLGMPVGSDLESLQQAHGDKT